FTVEAYAGTVYWGAVTQLRRAPITVQNVVTYDVVVGVDNPDLTLLPGMTANTRIVTDERSDVLRVPVTATRFTPSGSTPAAPTPPEPSGGQDPRPDGEPSAGGGPSPAAGPSAGGGSPSPGGPRRGGTRNAGRVWVLRDGTPTEVRVTTGLSDGTWTEI